MICDELVAFGFDQHTFSEAYDMLAHDEEQLKLFLDVPPKFRRGWIMRGVHKRKDLEIEEKMKVPIKKRKRNVF